MPAFFGPLLGTAAGPINSRFAENLATVTACVQAIASGIASLPPLVYATTPDGRIEAPNHPVARLVRQPNPRQTWPDFIEMMMSQVLLHGNGLAAIDLDGAGRPIGLNPIPWQCVSPVLLPSGALAFDVVLTASPWGGTGQPRRYLASDVLHLKDRSDDGWLGRSRISRAPEVLAGALGLQEYSTSLWQNAATPSGALKLPGALGADTFERLRGQLRERHQGARNAKGVLILESGAEWQSLSVSPEDAEVLQSRRFSVEELARLFQVPPPLIQDYTRNTFSNASTAGLWFAQFSLAPWAIKIEAEFSRSVFGSGSPYELTLDMSGLTRGDYAARWTANVAAVQAGILTVDEVREAEGFNPLGSVAPNA